jgi:hypothetical protein
VEVQEQLPSSSGVVMVYKSTEKAWGNTSSGKPLSLIAQQQPTFLHDLQKAVLQKPSQ